MTVIVPLHVQDLQMIVLLLLRCATIALFLVQMTVLAGLEIAM